MVEDSNQVPEKPEKPIDDLRKQAELLRAEIRAARSAAPTPGYSILRRGLYLIVIFLVLGGAFLLLSSLSTRRAVVDLLAGRIAPVPGMEERLFELPPPPPKPAATRTEVPLGPIILSERGFEGVLYADQAGQMGVATSAGAAGGAEEPRFVPPEKTAESNQAFSLLQAKVALAGSIVAGTSETFRFTEWTLLKEDPPVFLIDLLVTRVSDQRELHLVWEVDVERETVRPMSQAARDLAARPSE